MQTAAPDRDRKSGRPGRTLGENKAGPRTGCPRALLLANSECYGKAPYLVIWSARDNAREPVPTGCGREAGRTLLAYANPGGSFTAV